MKVLVLKKCTEQRTSNNGKFTYPEKGYVEAPDWNGKPECGGGLHGLLWGHGTFDLDPYGTLFLVIECDSENVIEFDSKCKFKCGNVLLTGNQEEAIRLLKSHPNYPKDNILNYDVQIDVKFAVAGYWSTLTGGYWSTLTGGNGSTLTGGNGSIFIVYYWKGGQYIPIVKKITKSTANKIYKFENGKFNLIHNKP